MLLNYGRIRDQYRRYDRFPPSENKDVAIRQALGQILDCIEDPTRLARPIDRDAKP
jgi:hypothetical protein